MINYSNIAKAVEFYQRDYTLIDVPWAVSYKAMRETLPRNHSPITVFTSRNEHTNLVGSGEQSFIQMMIDGKLEQGRYMCVTPCWRDDKLDETHQRYFMKVELISYMPPSDNMYSLDCMLEMAEWFFVRECGVQMEVKVEMQPPPSHRRLEIGDIMGHVGTQYDILCKGIELGSYGIRSFNDGFKQHTWVYGTGCAEPRLSYVQSLK